MRGVVVIFLLLSSICFSQRKTDSIRKRDSILERKLTKKIDSLQADINALKQQKKIIKRRRDSMKIWTVDGRFTFLFNQSTFSNWSSGGENNVSGTAVINYDFNYKYKNWKWDNKLITVFGASHISGKGYRKTDDRLEYNSVLAYNTRGSYYFSFFSNFITQYANGFDYNQDPREKVSSFLSPSYWSFGPGILFRKSDNLRVNAAPATSRFTFVDKIFSGKYGVPLGETVKYELGLSMSAYYKFDVLEDLTIENILALYSDYLNDPQNIDVNYQMNMYVSVNRYLSLNLTLHLISDKNASTRLQFRETFGLGVNYTFHKI